MRLGLAEGLTYLWVHRQGPAVRPWRAIIVSADGRIRQLVGFLKYTSDVGHTGSESPAEHAKRYSDGQLACFLDRPIGEPTAGSVSKLMYEGNWTRCAAGCCEVYGDE